MLACLMVITYVPALSLALRDLAYAQVRQAAIVGGGVAAGAALHPDAQATKD